MIQWFLSRSQRHQSYIHMVSYFNHFHLQEGVTFCINELHVSFAEMMFWKKSLDVNCFSDYQDGLQTDESRHQVKRKVHMCWYIRGRKNTVEVCSCGEHSIWKHSQVIIMQQSISTVFIWLDILTITEIKHQSNRYIILQLIQIYNITAYTITDTVNIQQQSVSDTHCPQSVLYRGTGIKDRIVHAITVNKEWWVNNQAAI